MKGFTLIELLAVIVILAIILLIAVPAVGRAIESSKIEALKISVQGIAKGAEIKLFRNSLNNIETNSLQLTDIEYQGKKYNIGSINIDNDDQIEVYIWDEQLEKCAYKAFNSSSVVIDNTKDETTCSSVVADELASTCPSSSAVYNLTSADAEYGCYSFDVGTKTVSAPWNYIALGCSRNIVIPTTIDGVPVERIGWAGFNFSALEWGDLTGVDLSKATNLIEIDGYAFNIADYSSVTPCFNLSGLINVETIGTGAFSGTGVTELDLRNLNKISNINFNVFEDYPSDSSLETIILPTDSVASAYIESVFNAVDFCLKETPSGACK